MGGVGKNLTGTGASGVNNGGKTSSDADKNALETEKRMRREIANSNERRRMQSINAGFQNLRSLLPRHEGEKLSKAAILQQTSSYICELEAQKTQLLSQNSQLKRLLGQHEPGSGGGGGGEVIACTTINGETITGVANKKRKLTDNIFSIQTISDSSDEGLGSMSPEPMTLLNNNGPSSSSKSQIILAHNAATKEILDLKKQLDKERRIRTMLEDELQMIKRQLYSVATAPQPSSTSSYIPREVIEHTDNLVRDTIEELPAGTVSYVEIDEMTGQSQVVVCSSIEELENEAAAAADEIITEDHVHEEVILSSSTESEQEVNAIAKAYAAGGSSPSPSVLQPILQAAIKATPKVEVERINDPIVKVKTEKIEQPSGLTRSRQNLETIVEAIRHLEGDHLFSDVNEQQKLQSHHNQQQKAQEAPLALTNKHQQHAQRATIAELRPYLQLKGNKQVTIVGGGGASVTLTQQQLAKSATAVSLKAAQQQQKESATPSATVTPTAIFKVQTNTPATTIGGGNVTNSGGVTQHITITSSALKQCRPGVIVAKQS
ncbi:uncharacterized protein LOC119689969 isoform X2 [Teleopsis dalmanni]|nr:uncharacterized protein LOC119689969 isoform X2 [Teleopsis dalmanni]